MNKKKMIKEIIQPVMEEKGFELVSDKHGVWTWVKEIQGLAEEVSISDMDGGLFLDMGLSGFDVMYCQERSLWDTLEHPRTELMDMYYRLSPDPESAFRNRLLDCREILVKNVDRVLEENARSIKKPMEDHHRRFNSFCDNYEKYVEKNSIEFQSEKLTLCEVVERVLQKIMDLHEEPIESVEETIIGYVAFVESLLKKEKGITNKFDRQKEFSLLVNEKGNSFNAMTDFFFLQKNPAVYDIILCTINELLGR